VEYTKIEKLLLFQVEQTMTAEQSTAVESVVEEVRDEYLGPAASGLYDPANEREACGVGFIVAIDRKRSHKVGT
jgi:Glutamate synthase domain 1